MLLSVVVVSFNHALFIEKCIMSIYAQLDVKFRLICIDNNSKDGSQSIIKKLSEKYKFEFIFNEENIGLSAALNQSLALVNTEFICFVAADDCLVFNRFNRQLEFLKNNNLYYACSGSQIKINDNDEVLPQKKQNNIIEKFKSIDDKYIFNNSNIIYSPTTIYRTAILKELGGYKEDVEIEDLYIFYLAAAKGLKMAILPFAFTFYRIHENNNHSKYLWMFNNKLKILDFYKGTKYYCKLSQLIYLEGFFSLSKSHKKHALLCLKKIWFRLDSKYLYGGIFRLFMRP